MYNPGEFTYEWLRDENCEIKVEDEKNDINLTESEKEQVDLTKETDLLYLVK